MALLYNLIKDINLFNKKNKRRGKKKRRDSSDEEGNENFQFPIKNDVKMENQNIKREIKKKKKKQKNKKKKKKKNETGKN